MKPVAWYIENNYYDSLEEAQFFCDNKAQLEEQVTPLYTADQLRQTVEDEAQNPWKRAIIDAAVVNWSYKKEHDSDPRAAINDLLAMEDNYVLDPQISERMAVALRQAKVEVLRELGNKLGQKGSFNEAHVAMEMADELEKQT